MTKEITIGNKQEIHNYYKMTKPTKEHKARKQNYTGLIINSLDDRLDLVHISANSSNEAYEELSESSHNFDNITILNKQQLKDLLKKLKELK